MRIYKILTGRTLLILLFVLTTSLAMAGEKLDSEFRLAAGMGQMERVQSLLKQGADINSRAPSTDDDFTVGI